MIARIASAVGKGIFAGLAGTAAMTVSSTIEAKVRGRKGSTVPADAVRTVLDVEPVGEEAKARLNTLTHWGYGTALGVPRGLLSLTPLSPPAATALHFGAAWGGEMAMLPALGLAPPPAKWGAKEVAIDAWHHLVYATAAGAAAALMRARR